MDMSDALMMVCVALTEGVESPLGHCALFDNDSDPMEEVRSDDLQVRRAAHAQGFQDMIADTVQTMEYSEQFTPGNKREAVYHSLYQLADQAMERKMSYGNPGPR